MAKNKMADKGKKAVNELKNDVESVASDIIQSAKSAKKEIKKKMK